MSIRRVLIVQPYGLGDLLFITPVLRALRLKSSVERVDLLLGSRTESLICTNPHVDEIMQIDKDRIHRQSRWKTYGEMISLGKKLRAKNYDLLLDYSMRGEYAFYSKFFLGIPLRAGYLYKRRGMFHNRRLPIPEGFHGRHVADYCCDLAEAAGIPVKDRWLEFYLPREDRRDGEEFIARHIPPEWRSDYMALSPGGGESWGRDAHFKRWPPAHYAGFAAKIAGKTGIRGAVILGGPGEKQLCEDLLGKLAIPAVNLAGLSSLRQSAYVIDRSRLFIGNDGGLLHIACARRKPVIGFYGPVDPAVYGPYPPGGAAAAIYKKDLECRPCYKKFRYKSDCAHRNCLMELNPSEAADMVESHPAWKEIRRETAAR